MDMLTWVFCKVKCDSATDTIFWAPEPQLGFFQRHNLGPKPYTNPWPAPQRWDLVPLQPGSSTSSFGGGWHRYGYIVPNHKFGIGMPPCHPEASLQLVDFFVSIWQQVAQWLIQSRQHLLQKLQVLYPLGNTTGTNDNIFNWK